MMKINLDVNQIKFNTKANVKFQASPLHSVVEKTGADVLKKVSAGAMAIGVAGIAISDKKCEKKEVFKELDSKRDVINKLVKAGYSGTEIANIMGVYVRSMYLYFEKRNIKLETNTKLKEIAKNIQQVRYLVSQGVSLNVIARNFKVSVHTIIKAIKDAQIEQNDKEFSKIQGYEDDIILLYEQGMSAYKIAKFFEVSENTIIEILLLNNKNVKKDKVLLKECSVGIKQDYENGADVNRLAQDYDVSFSTMQEVLSEENIERSIELEELYLNETNIRYFVKNGYIPAQIAYIYGVSEKLMQYFLKSIGTNVSIDIQKDFFRKHGKEMLKQAKDGMTIEEIANNHQIAIDTVEHYFRNHGARNVVYFDKLSRREKEIVELAERGGCLGRAATNVYGMQESIIYRFAEKVNAERSEVDFRDYDINILSKHENKIRNMIKSNIPMKQICEEFSAPLNVMLRYLNSIGIDLSSDRYENFENQNLAYKQDNKNVKLRPASYKFKENKYIDINDKYKSVLEENEENIRKLVKQNTFAEIANLYRVPLDVFWDFVEYKAIVSGKKTFDDVRTINRALKGNETKIKMLSDKGYSFNRIARIFNVPPYNVARILYFDKSPQN